MFLQHQSIFAFAVLDKCFVLLASLGFYFLCTATFKTKTKDNRVIGIFQ